MTRCLPSLLVVIAAVAGMGARPIWRKATIKDSLCRNARGFGAESILQSQERTLDRIVRRNRARHDGEQANRPVLDSVGAMAGKELLPDV